MRNHGRTDSTNGDGFRRLEVITGVGRRRRWSDVDKARIVAESLDPATTSSAVARRYGLQADLGHRRGRLRLPQGEGDPLLGGVALPHRSGPSRFNTA
jgi:transposase-like protein